MTISSRTPEGAPNRCPVCHADVQIVPSQSIGDAPCPNCGSLLWFASFSDEGIWFYDPETVAPVLQRVEEIVSETLGVSRDDSNASMSIPIGTDSLDLVDLAMALEEEFHVSIAEDDLPKIRKIADLVGYILRNRP